MLKWTLSGEASHIFLAKVEISHCNLCLGLWVRSLFSPSSSYDRNLQYEAESFVRKQKHEEERSITPFCEKKTSLYTDTWLSNFVYLFLTSSTLCPMKVLLCFPGLKLRISYHLKIVNIAFHGISIPQIYRLRAKISVLCKQHSCEGIKKLKK